MRHEASLFAGTLAPVFSYAARPKASQNGTSRTLGPCANCIATSPKTGILVVLIAPAPSYGGVSEKPKKLAEQLRDNYGGIILDRVRKDI